ncbi:Uncharacterised protein g8887 [Pycnogonum litorale]
MTDVSTAKSVFALAVVVGCFAILWPKIFFPMMQTALKMTTSNTEDDVTSHRPPHVHSGMGRPTEHPNEGIQRKPGRPPIPRHPGQILHNPQQQSTQGGGAMGLIMPVYTIGVILFFFYTLFKVMSKKSDDKVPILKNLNMDPEHRKFVFSEECDGETNLRRRKSSKLEQTIPETEENDDDDDEDVNHRELELRNLRQRLADTEAAMNRIVKQMGDTKHRWAATVPSELKENCGKNLKSGTDNANKDARNVDKDNRNETVSNSTGNHETKEQNDKIDPVDKKSIENRTSDMMTSFEDLGTADDKDHAVSETHNSETTDQIQLHQDGDNSNDDANHEISSSSFECISSGDTTPLSPEKNLNVGEIVTNTPETKSNSSEQLEE